MTSNPNYPWPASGSRESIDRRMVVLVRRGPRASFRRYAMSPDRWDRLIRLLTPVGVLPDLGKAELILAIDGAEFHAADVQALATEIRRLLERIRRQKPCRRDCPDRVVLIVDRSGEAMDASISYSPVDAREVLDRRDIETLADLATFLVDGRFTLRRSRRQDSRTTTTAR